MNRLLKFLLLAFCFLPGLLAAQTPHAGKGVLDLRAWDFRKNGSVNLRGEWEFYMRDLFTPEEFKAGITVPTDYTEFPSTWNNLNKGNNPGDGYATYRLKVLIKNPQPWAIELPQFYSNYILWINGKRIASNGQVGTSIETSKPQWLPQTVSFSAKKDTLDIIIQISNFHHTKGGVREPILLGLDHELNFKHDLALTSGLMLSGSLLIIALVAAFLFLSKKDQSLLYLSALSITWAVRALFSNQYIANFYIREIPWELSVKIEYITLYMTMIWSVLFVGSLFKNEVNTAFKYLLCICNVIFTVLTLLFPASLYTQFLPVYLSFCVIDLLYLAYILVRALVYERQGVWLLIASLFLGIILFSYDLVSYQVFATFHPLIMNVGYFIIFILMALSLLYQLGLLKARSSTGNTLTYEDLYGDSKHTKM